MGKMKPTRSIVNFFSFVAFFPQLVAGPIERARHLLPQFSVARKFDYSIARSGGKLILIGFFKKICVADSLALLVDAAYGNPEYYSGFPMFVATIFFAFQIYCDFSGYSDIAIGTARILGFDIMTNFRAPYFAKSLTEFWRRWHISLSTWFRDYVYIPLGGSRVGNYKMMSNIFITFILSGLWHGANWTYIAWGAIHGIFLIVEKLFFKTGIMQKSVIKDGLSTIFTFLIICFAWIFFRSNTISDAYYIITHMFSDISDLTNITTILFKFKTMGLKVIGMKMTLFFFIVFLVMEASILSKGLMKIFEKHSIVRWTVYFFLLILIIISASRIEAENFIYFQF
jgi:D-alanyl-lipoteichoic acid acyltransferase DltB (MBOAT superfamily)